MLDYPQLIGRIRALTLSARSGHRDRFRPRLMTHHLSLPAAERDPLIALAPDLDKLWQALLAPSSEVDEALRKLLKKRKSEPYADQIGKNGWPRGDDHPFAATINALEAYCLIQDKFAVGATMRLIDATSEMADTISKGRRFY